MISKFRQFENQHNQNTGPGVIKTVTVGFLNILDCFIRKIATICSIPWFSTWSRISPFTMTYLYFYMYHSVWAYDKLCVKMWIINDLSHLAMPSVYFNWLDSRDETLLYWLHNVTINDISVIQCDGTYMCRRNEEGIGPTVRLQRHIHFVGFFNVPV